MATIISYSGTNIAESHLYDYSGDRLVLIGEPYTPGETNWREGGNYGFFNNIHNLMICYNNPSPKEIDAIANGEVEFRLYIEKDLVDLVFRFDRENHWNDVQFCWHKNLSKAGYTPPTLKENEIALLNIILLDTKGILRAFRAIGLGPEFSSKLHDAILAQMKMPYDQTVYEEHIATLYRMFNSKELAYRSKVKVVVKPRKG